MQCTGPCQHAKPHFLLFTSRGGSWDVYWCCPTKRLGCCTVCVRRSRQVEITPRETKTWTGYRTESVSRLGIFYSKYKNNTNKSSALGLANDKALATMKVKHISLTRTQWPVPPLWSVRQGIFLNIQSQAVSFLGCFQHWHTHSIYWYFFYSVSAINCTRPKEKHRMNSHK